MEKQNYEKNYSSYSKLVQLSRQVHQLEFIIKEVIELEFQVRNVVGDANTPFSFKTLKQCLWSLHLRYSKQYSEMFIKHFEMLDGSNNDDFSSDSNHYINSLTRGI